MKINHKKVIEYKFTQTSLIKKIIVFLQMIILVQNKNIFHKDLKVYKNITYKNNRKYKMSKNNSKIILK
jgi:hypothetical protein